MYHFKPTSAWVERVARWPFPLGTLFFLTTSKIGREVFKRVVIDHSTDTALHPIYDYREELPGLSVWDHRWQSSKAAQSLRFRFDWICKQLTILIRDYSHKKMNVFGVSLGSGTGLAFMQTLEALKLADDQITITFVDEDERTLLRAKTLMEAHHLLGQIEFLVGHSSDALVQFKDDSQDFVELVGIAEYVDDAWLAKETAAIYQVLAPGGCFVGATISSPDESAFAHKVLHWPAMRYRTQDQISAVLQSAGFAQITLVPCGIFVGWLARK